MSSNNDGPTVLGNVNINGIDYEVKVKCLKEDVHNYTLVSVNCNEFITGYSITYNSESLENPVYGYSMYIWRQCYINTFFPSGPLPS